MRPKIDALLIAGPTASGKSALALELAKRLGGVIINADSMQVYRDLRVLTARPSKEEEAEAPHRLYGHLDASASYSAGDWGAEALAEIEAARGAGALPIVVGGTGLYFSVLTEGLSPIPEVPEAVRAEVRGLLENEGVEAVLSEVRQVDPEIAAQLKPADRQRLARALEVFQATGRPLSAWQKEPRVPLFTGKAGQFVLMPERDWLYERCDRRFDIMLEGGALDEVRALKSRQLPPDLPALKALGVPELCRYLDDEFTLEEARLRAKMQTRRYAKRQMTWFRNQMIAWEAISKQESEKKIDEILSFIC
ncbi:MAG: tRNA (adenosine(37)-N6)-dimethylallyltransferase MiaA [Alphaproteobacteria bacterium]|nr:MAG: tRNA (adenosine(37)-N6)-dimethylallyltransferase MiaA [Alphaproteobacteria bacterium]